MVTGRSRIEAMLLMKAPPKGLVAWGCEISFHRLQQARHLSASA